MFLTEPARLSFAATVPAVLTSPFLLAPSSGKAASDLLPTDGFLPSWSPDTSLLLRTLLLTSPPPSAAWLPPALTAAIAAAVLGAARGGLDGAAHGLLVW